MKKIFKRITSATEPVKKTETIPMYFSVIFAAILL